MVKLFVRVLARWLERFAEGMILTCVENFGVAGDV